MLDYSTPKQFPTRDATDGQLLYLSLGSFWTEVFNDKNALKGYTIGMAEELIQAYLNLTNVVRQYSVNDIDLFRKEKWLPILIKKSEFNKSPLLFEPSAAIFGNQPADDLLYPNQLFRFGFSKEGSSNSVFSFYCGKTLKKLGLISDRIIAPSVVLLEGTDILLQDAQIYFNSNIFEHPGIRKVRLIDDTGNPAIFKDNEGRVYADELILLWGYMAEYDDDTLYKNFGTLFDVRFETSQSYKDLLSALMNIAVEGPTIQALKFALAALLGTPVVLNNTETVEDIYSDKSTRYVVTDAHVYKLPLDQYLGDNIYIDNKIYCGDPLTDSIKVVDTVIDPVWWKTDIKSSKLAFSSHVFAASATHQLFFENKLQQIKQTQHHIEWKPSSSSTWSFAFDISKLNIALTEAKPIALKKGVTALQYRRIDQEEWLDLLPWSELTAGYTETGNNVDVQITYRTHFPVYGRSEDVEAFQQYINAPSRKYQLLDKLNMPRDTTAKVTINPLDFVFTNIFKNNTLLLKVYFTSADKLNVFFDLLPTIQKYLPPHVYVLVYAQLNLDVEEIVNLNYGLSIPAFPNEAFSLDGSSRSSGARPKLGDQDDLYYKDYKDRLFCISVGPYKNLIENDYSTKQPLHYNIDPEELADPDSPSNLDMIQLVNGPTTSSGPSVRCGTMRTEIPESIIPPGESTPRAPTTREVPSILLIDF